MNNPQHNPLQRSSDPKRTSSNRTWFFVGVIPFLPSLLVLPVALLKPSFLKYFVMLLLAPLYAFCPLDILHVHSALSSGQLVVWGCISGVVYIAAAVYGFFKWPFGIIFALLVWSSVVVLAFRLLEASKYIH
jgi:hypothetical protein